MLLRAQYHVFSSSVSSIRLPACCRAGGALPQGRCVTLHPPHKHRDPVLYETGNRRNMYLEGHPIEKVSRLFSLGVLGRAFNGLTTTLNILARAPECIASEYADSEQCAYQQDRDHLLNCFHLLLPFVLAPECFPRQRIVGDVLCSFVFTHS